MALRKEKIVGAAGVQRSGGAGEKEEVLGIAFGYLEIPLCTPAPLPLCNPYAAYSSAWVSMWVYSSAWAKVCSSTEKSMIGCGVCVM
ncbi:hypothetical protein [Nostoc flagelliforme]|uniref:hypothetical protein n=1 Tax=Nostoc flagelliforme TaxID=1306274 RepID=UPI00142D34C7|nr:hypothetical protein [Nostoc flagelliforme]